MIRIIALLIIRMAACPVCSTGDASVSIERVALPTSIVILE